MSAYYLTDSSVAKELEFTRLGNHFSEASSKGDFASRYFSYLSKLLAELDVNVIEQILNVFLEAAECCKTIYLMGNGGSAAAACHFANDLTIGTRAPGVKPIKAMSLTDNLSILTAVANDEGYANIFVSQLYKTLRPKDVAVAFSVSGNSENILRALRFAKENGAVTIGCTGFEGGEILQIVDINLHVPTYHGEYGPVEDIFTILGHLIYSYLKLERLGRL
jgi:D-sedoheptulose 7-phosphate isomerase